MLEISLWIEWFKVQDFLYWTDKNLQFILSLFQVFFSWEILCDGGKFPWPSYRLSRSRKTRCVCMGSVWGGCWGQRSHFRVTHTNIFIRTFLYCFGWFAWEVYSDLEHENRLVPFGGQKPFMSIVWRKLLLHDLFPSQTQQSRCWYKRRLNLFGVFIPSEWTEKCLGLENGNFHWTR